MGYKRKYKQPFKIIPFVFLVLVVVICLRVSYNIEHDGQQGNLIWEFGKAFKDIFVDLFNGFKNKQA